MSTMKLFACGGAGLNITQEFLRFSGNKEAGFADIQPVFVDTSRSNLNPNVPEDLVYLIEGLDGSGKKRDSNYTIISEKCKDILHKYKPADLNVVIHSASGGSGSVIGPVLVSELLGRNESVIVIVIGTSDSRIEAHNTCNTLKSYEVISHKRDKPVVSIYYENTKDNPRGSVDAKIQTDIVVLAAFFSGDNRELDSADLANFLNYPRVTSFSPKLARLEFYSNSIDLDKGHTVTALATLVDESTSSTAGQDVEYQAVGFISDAGKKSVQVPLPIHAAIISGYYHDVIERLMSQIKKIDDVRSTVVEKAIVSGDHGATDDGLVL